MTGLLRVFTLTAALLGLLAIVACGDDEGGGPSPPAVGGETPTVQVTPTPTPAAVGGAIEIGIDPEITGNTCAESPADCTLGPIEQCYEITCPSEQCTWDGRSPFDGTSDYVIDVYISDPVGSAPAPVVYDAWVYYDQGIVHIAAPGTDGKIKIPGADFGGGDEIALPDSDGKFMGGWMFLAGMPDLGVNTYVGDGPLLRLGLDIGASGLVTFTFHEEGSTYLSVGPGGWPNVQSHPLTFKTGQLAINQTCPEQ
jgi:hypothetical protein